MVCTVGYVQLKKVPHVTWICYFPGEQSLYKLLSKQEGLIALSPLYFANCVILHPLLFFERFCTLSFCPLSDFALNLCVQLHFCPLSFC